MDSDGRLIVLHCLLFDCSFAAYRFTLFLYTYLPELLLWFIMVGGWCGFGWLWWYGCFEWGVPVCCRLDLGILLVLCFT